MKNAKKSLSYHACTFQFNPGDKDKTTFEWTEREETKLFEYILDIESKHSIFDLALKLKRDPVFLLQQVLHSETLDMVGFECPANSEEQAEFFGLALSGVPVPMAIRWCMADVERVSSTKLAEAMSGPDMRPSIAHAMECGVWFTCAGQSTDLLKLASYSIEDTQMAVAKALANFDAPTPAIIFQCLSGAYVASKRVYPWFDLNAVGSVPSGKSMWSKNDSKKKTSGTTKRRAHTYRKTSARRPYGVKKRSSRSRSPSYA